MQALLWSVRHRIVAVLSRHIGMREHCATEEVYCAVTDMGKRMLFYLTGMRTIAAVLVWIAVLAGCSHDGRSGIGDDEREPMAARKAASSPAAVISVLGVRG